MRTSHGRKLWQMRDAQHLLMAGKLCQLFSYLLCRPAGHAGVHLVKNQRSDLLLLCQHIFQCQHNAGQLAAGGDFGNWAQRFSGVG